MRRRQPGRSDAVRLLLAAAGLIVVLAACDGRADPSATPTDGDPADPSPTPTERAEPPTGPDETEPGPVTQPDPQRGDSPGAPADDPADAPADDPADDPAGDVPDDAPDDGPGDPLAVGQVDEAAHEPCTTDGLSEATRHGDDVRLAAGYATHLGALRNWRADDGPTTVNVSISDTTRDDDEPVAVCYYDGSFAGPRDQAATPAPRGRLVTRVAILVHDDGDTRMIIRGDAERLDLYRPPDWP